MMIHDRYQLGEQLGKGGMGTVYLGTDRVTKEAIAIKQLRPDMTNEELIERFKREGEALRELNHPNIVKMRDAVQDGDNYYLIMDYVSGGDLSELMQQDALPLKKILTLSIDLADALTRAHKLNIIHRDLKPANVLIADDGTLHLTDFGVALIGNKESVTDPDAMVGTLDYLPPEMMLGSEYAESGDIWAFGILLYQMVTGNHPFMRETVMQTIHAITTEPVPDLEELRPDAPIALIDLIYRMLDKSPTARIASVRHVGAVLEDILQGRDTSSAVIHSRFAENDSQVFTRTTNNLPAQVTEFIGREDEISALSQLLTASSPRLITILAPGGMGKTRLALTTAERNLNQFADGVYFVDLTALSEASGIVPAVMDALSLSPMPGAPPEQQLINFLHDKTCLLVIDNWEHIVDGADITTRLLQSAPNIKILATSRVRLQQSGESLYQLAGMDFPQWETPGDALEYAAVKLFMSSALRAQPDFELTVDNLDYVARICRLVQGMPLGIVLAAAWLGMLSAEEIADELQDGMDILADERGELPERQQSIRLVMDYSWQLLSDDEQPIFMKLSYFRGGITRESAKAVAGAKLRTLMSLVNKSLLRRDSESGRYYIHELLRQFAEEKLQNSDLLDTTRNAHLDYFAGFLEERTPLLYGDLRMFDVGQEVTDDLENIERAWHWATQQQNLGQLERLAEGFTLYYLDFGQTYQKPELINEARQQLEALSDERAVRLKIFLDPAYSRIVMRSQTDLALSLAESALNYGRKHDDFAITQNAIQALILLPAQIGIERAFKLVQEQLQLATAKNDKWWMANAYNARSNLAIVVGQYDTVLDDIRHAVELNNEINNLSGNGLATSNLAAVLAGLGFWDEARVENHNGLDAAVQAKVIFGVAAQNMRLAALDYFAGTLDLAEEQANTAIQLIRDYNYYIILSGAHNILAEVAWARGEFDQAKIQSDTAIAMGVKSNRISYHRRATMKWMVISTFFDPQSVIPDENQQLITQGLGAFELAIRMEMVLAIACLKAHQGDPQHASDLLAIIAHHPRCPQIYKSGHKMIDQLRESLPKPTSTSIDNDGIAQFEQTVQALIAEFSPD